MIDLTGQVSMPFFKKSRITGSESGMRFLIQKAECEDDRKQLEAIAWPEPYCFEVTPEEQKSSARFEYSETGLAGAIAWLNELHEGGTYENSRNHNGIL